MVGLLCGFEELTLNYRMHIKTKYKQTNKNNKTKLSLVALVCNSSPGEAGIREPFKTGGQAAKVN